MSAQLFLPTPHCPYIGPVEVPFTHPDGVPRAVLGWVTEVANLTRPDEIHWWAGRWKERAALPHLRRGTGALAAPPLFDGCMRGRRMFVVPYSLTTVQDEPEQLGIEITDSPYVVLSLTAIARTGRRPLGQISAGQHWAPSVHSVGYPLIDADGHPRPDLDWPCNHEKWIAQFPDSEDVWSYGTGERD